jgi:hypothetical protein
VKVRLVVTVDVDPAKWREVYGQDDVRRDVRDYVLSTLQQSPGVEESEAEVTVR